MRFAHPAWLAWIWVAPLVAALYAWGHRRRARILRAFAEPGALAQIAPARSDTRRWTAAGLLTAGVLLTSLALAGPQYGFSWRKTERRGVDLIVAVDCSRSMLAQDVSPNRLARAKREVVDLVNRVQGDRIGLVAFAGTAFLQCPLTLDYTGLHVFLQALTPGFLPVGGTDLAGAIDTAREGFDPQSPAERAILVITDGGETSGAAARAAERAQKDGIRVYVLGVGTPEGAPIPLPKGGFVKDGSGQIVLARLGEDALEKLAARTGGVYARAVPGDEDLDAVYTKGIRADMTARALETKRVKAWEDRYQWPLALAVLALLAELFLPLRNRAARSAALVLLLALGALAPAPARADGASSLVRQGLERYRTKDFAGAQKAFIQAQVQEPDAPEIAFDLGNARYRAGDFESAFSSYSDALRNAPDDLKAKILYNRGNAAYRSGRLQDAVRDYEAALKRNAGDEDARLNLAFVKRRMEEKPPPQTSSGGKDEPKAQGGPQDQKQLADEGAGKDRQEKGPAQKNAPGQADQEKPAPEAASPKGPENAGKQRAGSQDPGSSGSQQSGSGENAPTPEPREARGRGTPANGAERERARALLNRLEDQPGKAFLPSYGKRRVDKDW